MSSFEIVNDAILTTQPPSNTSTIPAINCNIYTQPNYDTALSIVCSVMCLFGFVYTFFGYRCFKAVMFLSGLIFGGSVVYVICQEDRIFHQNLKLEIIIGIAIGIGVLCGFITMLIKYVGLFLQGFFLGVLLAIAGIVALQKFYHPSTPWVPVGILFGTGVLFSVLTLKWQKTFVIISTGTVGGALIIICVEYFVEKLVMLRYIWEALMASTSVPVCWYTWIVFAMWPLLAVIGCIIQWKITSKGYDHTDVVIWRGNRKRVRTHLVRNRHAEERPRQETLPQDSSRGSRRQRSRERVSTQHTNVQQLPNNVQRQHSNVQRPPPTTSPSEQMLTPFNTDTLPPSYFDCVEKGIGKIVKEEDQSKIIRTKKGSFLMQNQHTAGPSNLPHSNPSNSIAGPSNRHNSNPSNIAGPSNRHNSNPSNRHANPSNTAAVTSNREVVTRLPEVSNRGGSSASSSQNATPSHSNVQSSRGGGRNHADRQSLLATRPSNREAMAVHARRIHQAQTRRTNINPPA